MLICPLCQTSLHIGQTEAICDAGHRFDRARQGYFNLLPVQFKKSRAPGDDPAMVDARRQFLEAGHYAPLAERLCQLAAQCEPAHWLDIGCGEGYYTHQLANALPNAQGYGLDISREAVRRACRRDPSLLWLVASMARIPLANESCQLITSVFSPLDWQEAIRLLPVSGHVLRLGPGRDHLLELRQRLYDEVRSYDDEKHVQQVPKNMSLRQTDRLEFTLSLEDYDTRAHLLAMTPHSWRVNPERRERILDAPFSVTVSVRYDLWQRMD